MVGIPGGLNGEYYEILKLHNKPRGPYNLTMTLKADIMGGNVTKDMTNTTQDEANTVWVMDSSVFPFYAAETYHQFHSNFFHNPDQPRSDGTGRYPDSYVKGLYSLQASLGRIPSNGCPDSYCPPDGGTGDCHW